MDVHFGQVEALNHSPSQPASGKLLVTRRSFRLLAIAFGVTVALLILIFILLWILVPTTSAAGSKLCTSETCITASAMLLHNLNLSADPCQDFFNFACGGFQQRTPYTVSSIRHGLSVLRNEREILQGRVFELLYRPELVRSDDAEVDKMFNATRDIFMSCIKWHKPPNSWILPNNSDSLWSPSSTQSAFDLESLARPLIQEIEKRPPTVEEYLAVLVKTQATGLIKLSEHIYARKDNLTNRKRGPVLGFHTVNFHFTSEWNSSIASSLIEKLCTEMNITLTVNSSLTASEQRRLLNQPHSETFFGTLEQLQQRTEEIWGRPGFSWIKFANHLRPDLATTGLKIVVENFAGFIQVLKRFSSEYSINRGSLYDFIRLEALLSLRSFLPNKFSFLSDTINSGSKNFINNNNEGSGTNEISKTCTEISINSMIPVVCEMFKRAYGVPDTFPLIDKLIMDIKAAMEQNVFESTWLLERRKQAIYARLKDIKQTISYTDIPISDVKQMYKKAMLRFDAAKRFGDMLLVSREARFSLLLWILSSDGPAFSAYDARQNPLIVNAYYIKYYNKIIIPIGILSSHLYNKDYPKYLLYGGIGEVIGHEIGHAFDPSAIVGTVYRDFDEANRSEYLKKLYCLADFYGKLMLTPSVPVDGNKTVGENFADIVGINAAFRAYKTEVARSQEAEPMLPELAAALSPEKLFFVQTAQFYCSKMIDKVATRDYTEDSHSPPVARVVGMMTQSKDFSRVFGCRPGNKMHLDDGEKCNFW